MAGVQGRQSSKLNADDLILCFELIVAPRIRFPSETSVSKLLASNAIFLNIYSKQESSESFPKRTLTASSLFLPDRALNHRCSLPWWRGDWSIRRFQRVELLLSHHGPFKPPIPKRSLTNQRVSTSANLDTVWSHPDLEFESFSDWP